MKKLRFLSLLSCLCSFAALPSSMQAAPSFLTTLCTATVIATTQGALYGIDYVPNSWVRSFTAPDTDRYWAVDMVRTDNGDILTVGPYSNDPLRSVAFT